MLAYYGYFGRARAERIRGIQDQLEHLALDLPAAEFFLGDVLSQSNGDSFGPTFVIDLSQGPSIPGGGGEYDLHVTVTVMGQSTTTVVEGVPKPDDMSAFCAPAVCGVPTQMKCTSAMA